MSDFSCLIVIYIKMVLWTFALWIDLNNLPKNSFMVLAAKFIDDLQMVLRFSLIQLIDSLCKNGLKHLGLMIKSRCFDLLKFVLCFINEAQWLFYDWMHQWQNHTIKDNNTSYRTKHPLWFCHLGNSWKTFSVFAEICCLWKVLAFQETRSWKVFRKVSCAICKHFGKRFEISATQGSLTLTSSKLQMQFKNHKKCPTSPILIFHG